MNRKIVERMARWLPLLLWMGLIFYFSNQPKGSLPEFGGWDLLVKKGAHMAAYGLLALLARFAGLSPIASLLLAGGYAISDEFHQTFIRGRNGTAVDVVIDTLGALLALWSAPLLWQKWQQVRAGLQPQSQSGRKGAAAEPPVHDA